MSVIRCFLILFMSLNITLPYKMKNKIINLMDYSERTKVLDKTKEELFDSLEVLESKVYKQVIFP